MDLMKKTIHMDQVRCSADAQTTVEDDINITDSKPDAYHLYFRRRNPPARLYGRQPAL